MDVQVPESNQYNNSTVCIGNTVRKYWIFISEHFEHVRDEASMAFILHAEYEIYTSNNFWDTKN